MANVCWQCGDIGLSEALLYCSKCKITPRHSYCLDEIPENIPREIVWLCQDCKAKFPNSPSNNKSPKFVSLGTHNHRSHRNKIRPKNPCHGIKYIQDHLVKTQDQHPYPVSSSLNIDNHVSSDLHRKTSSCSTDLLGIVRSSACLGLKEDKREEYAKEKTKRRRLILPDSSASLGLKEDKREAYAKDTTKRRRLILPDEDELGNFNPLINGQVNNFRSAVQKVPVNSVDASDRQIKGETKIQKSQIKIPCQVSSPSMLVEEYVKGNPKRSRLILPDFKLAVPAVQKYVKEPKTRRLILPDKDESDNLHSVIDSEGTSVQAADKSRPFNSIEGSARQSRSQAVFQKSQIKLPYQQALPSMTVEEYVKQKPNRRISILRDEDELDNFHSLIDGQGTDFQGAVKRLPNSSIEASERQSIGQIDNHKSQPKFSCQVAPPTKPVISHVWRGYFNISSAELGPFRAHLSSKACKKVCDVARNLPSVLHMQKLRRLDAWPESFKVSSPTADDIALYFFSESYRIEAVLDGLVDDIINNDLMLRFQFDEAELLVFSSFVLPYKHKSFFGKYYAWGVFKRRSIQVCSVPACLETSREIRKTLGEMKEGLICYNGEYSDDAKLVEQQSELKSPADHMKLAEQRQQKMGSEMTTESPTVSRKIEEGGICYDDFVGISRNSKPTSIELFPMHVEDISIAVKFRTNKNDID